MTVLQEIISELQIMSKGSTVHFDNGQQTVCSVLFDDMMAADYPEPIEVFEITYSDYEVGEIVTEMMRDIDIVAMKVFTELRKNNKVLN